VAPDSIIQTGRAQARSGFRYAPTMSIEVMRIVATSIVRIILYVQEIPKVARFYERYFGMKALPSDNKAWLELASDAGGCILALHQASRAQQSSAQQSSAAMKIVFGVPDVRAFVADCERDGLKFGPIHEAGEFLFANVKDPAGNPVQVSNRITTAA
jgi:predicted enzyme related to lactoylglutathione lyase